jgi:hypothetical protein
MATALCRLDIRTSAGCASRTDWRGAPQTKELRKRHDHEVAHGYDSHLIGRDQVNVLTPGVEVSAIPDTGAVGIRPRDGSICRASCNS